LEAYDRALHLEKGTKLRRRNLVYHIERDLATIDWIIEAFPNSPAASAESSSSRQPAISGMLPCRERSTISAMSAAQVRQTLYDPTLVQWRNYATQLEGLQRQLATAGTDVDG